MCALRQFPLRQLTQSICKHKIHQTYYQSFKVYCLFMLPSALAASSFLFSQSDSHFIPRCPLSFACLPIPPPLHPSPASPFPLPRYFPFSLPAPLSTLSKTERKRQPHHGERERGQRGEMKGRVSQGGTERTDRDRRCNRVVGRLKSQETILSYEQKRVRGGGG